MIKFAMDENIPPAAEAAQLVRLVRVVKIMKKKRRACWYIPPRTPRTPRMPRCSPSPPELADSGLDLQLLSEFGEPLTGPGPWRHNDFCPREN